MSFSVINTIFKCTCISTAIFVCNLTRTFEFIILKESDINSTIFCDKMSFTSLTTSLDGSLVTWTITKSYLAMYESIISEQTILLIIFSNEFTSSMILMFSHLPIIRITVLFCENGINTISICEIPFEKISISIVNSSLSMFFSLGVDLSFIIATIKVSDFSCLGSHSAILEKIDLKILLVESDDR